MYNEWLCFLAKTCTVIQCAWGCIEAVQPSRQAFEHLVSGRSWPWYMVANDVIKLTARPTTGRKTLAFGKSSMHETVLVVVFPREDGDFFSRRALFQEHQRRRFI